MKESMLALPKARVVLAVLKSPKSWGQAGSFPGSRRVGVPFQANAVNPL